jgi:hypothetical protein
MAASSSDLQEIHRVKHGLVNAETAMTLAVHRLLNSIHRMTSSSQSTDKAAKAVFYLSMASIYTTQQLVDIITIASSFLPLVHFFAPLHHLRLDPRFIALSFMTSRKVKDILTSLSRYICNCVYVRVDLVWSRSEMDGLWKRIGHTVTSGPVDPKLNFELLIEKCPYKYRVSTFGSLLAYIYEDGLGERCCENTWRKRELGMPNDDYLMWDKKCRYAKQIFYLTLLSRIYRSTDRGAANAPVTSATRIVLYILNNWSYLGWAHDKVPETEN